MVGTRLIKLYPLDGFCDVRGPSSYLEGLSEHQAQVQICIIVELELLPGEDEPLVLTPMAIVPCNLFPTDEKQLRCESSSLILDQEDQKPATVTSGCIVSCMLSFSTRAWHEWLLLRLHVVWWTGAVVVPGMFQAHVLMVRVRVIPAPENGRESGLEGLSVLVLTWRASCRNCIHKSRERQNDSYVRLHLMQAPNSTTSSCSEKINNCLL